MELGESSDDSQAAVLRYRNRDITNDDLGFLRNLCAASWRRRTDLARSICEAWDWRQANGEPTVQGCLNLLLHLERRRLLELPSHAYPSHRRARRSFASLPLPPELIPLTGLAVGPQADLEELCVRPIVCEERVGWRVYMDRYHYLGDRPIVGEHILYAAFLDNELVALLGWAAAALRAPLRDAYVGWDESTKRNRLHLVANNVRFLILPWVRVRHLASRVLALNLRRLSADWQEVWKHPVLLAETFVDTTRFRGTCYRASNWRYLGQTAGRFKRGDEYGYGATKKALFVYPLGRDATRRLRERA